MPSEPFARSLLKGFDELSLNGMEDVKGL